MDTDTIVSIVQTGIMAVISSIFVLHKGILEKDAQALNEIRNKISTVFLGNHAKLININRDEKNISSDQLHSIESISSEIQKLSVELDVKNGLLPQKDWIRKILFLPRYSNVKIASENMKMVSERVLPRYKSTINREISNQDVKDHLNDIEKIGELLRIDTKHG